MTHIDSRFSGRRRERAAVARERLENLVEGLADALGWRSYRIPRSKGVEGFPYYVMVRGNRLIFAFLASSEKRTDWRARAWYEDLRRVEFMDVVIWTPENEEAVGIELDREAKRAARYRERPPPPVKYRVP